MIFRQIRFSLILVALMPLAGCFDSDLLDGPTFERPATAVDYEVELEGLPEEDMQDLAEDALDIYRLQDEGAATVAFLRRRARADIDQIQKLLRSRGYFNGKVEVEVTRTDIEPGADQPAENDGEIEALVTYKIDPGPPFILESHGFVLDDPSALAALPPAAALGSPVGAPAVAADILKAETAAVLKLTETGFPYAKRGERDAVADLENATLTVDTLLDTGPAARFGKIEFRGLEDVRERYLRTYVPWMPGEVWNSKMIADFQRDLLATDLFAAITVKPPENPPFPAGPGPLPVIVSAEEAPFRSVSGGLAYSTADGPSAKAAFEHRNLYGENEKLNLEAFVSLERQFAGLGYREPQYMRPGQELFSGITFNREEDDAFDEMTVTVAAGLERELSETLTIGSGLSLVASQITDQGVTENAYLVQAPTFAAFDRTNDLLNPTRGWRARTEITPSVGIFDEAFAGFLTLDQEASTYIDLTGEKSYILALRGRIGSILSEDLDSIPANQRLYAGGGGSVRGYENRFVGPLDSNLDPVGGRSVVELNAEMRARVWEDIGAVAFVDAGTVSRELFPDFEEGLQYAVGLGVRYYSPIGPLRFDVAFPLDRRASDDFFQFYFSIGQAF